MKLLFCGDVQGCFSDFFRKLQTLNQSAHGPFDACFCTGSFFLAPPAPNADSEDADTREETAKEALERLRTWEGQVPLSVYFVLGEDRRSDCIRTALSTDTNKDGQLISNVHFLGNAGVKNVKGLQVGYLSGIQDASGYTASASENDKTITREEVNHVLTTAKESNLELGIDILLTSQWPYNFQQHVAPPLWPNFEEKYTNETASVTSAADMAAALRPRYHFAATCGIFYQRPPYRNLTVDSKHVKTLDGGKHDGSHVTRFIGLGAVTGSPPKTKKYVHALNLQPLTKVPEESLKQQPEGTTKNPYLEAPNYAVGQSRARGKRIRTDMSEDKVKELQREGDEEADAHKQVFWNIRGKSKSGKKSNETDEERNRKRQKIAEQQQRFFRQSCFFCMSSPAFESHMVVSIAEESFLTLPKGPVNENHVLVVPLDHASRLANSPNSLLLELAQYKLALRQYFGSKGLCMVAFERVVKTRHPAHTHLQVFGMKPSHVLSAPNEFMEQGKKVKAEFAFLDDSDEFKEYFCDAEQYFYVECFTDVYSHREIDDLKSRKPTDPSHRLVGDCIRLGYKIPEGQRFPLQFGRDVVCQLLGCPDRKFWKDCASDQNSEAQETEKFRNGFASFDFALDESDDE